MVGTAINTITFKVTPLKVGTSTLKLHIKETPTEAVTMHFKVFAATEQNAVSGEMVVDGALPEIEQDAIIGSDGKQGSLPEGETEQSTLSDSEFNLIEEIPVEVSSKSYAPTPVES